MASDSGIINAVHRSLFHCQRFSKYRKCLTKRAPDAGDSGEIPSIFLRLSIFPVGRRSAARPSAGNANRWAAKSKIGFDLQGSFWG
jgi:hypothetical protein